MKIRMGGIGQWVAITCCLTLLGFSMALLVLSITGKVPTEGIAEGLPGAEIRGNSLPDRTNNELKFANFKTRIMKWMNMQSPGLQRKKKLLLTLPLVVVPLLTLLFVALGGGKGIQGPSPGGTGFNLRLPAARLKGIRGWTKLNFYQQADLDSEKSGLKRMSEPLSMEPDSEDAVVSGDMTPASAIRNVVNPAPPSPASSGEDPWQGRIARIRQLIRDTGKDPFPVAAGMETGNPDPKSAISDPGVGSAPDPQLEQMNLMLDKILEIQHPGSVPGSGMGGPAGVRTPVVVSPDGVGAPAQDSSGFFGLDPTPMPVQNTIPATVAESSSLVTGATVCLRTSSEMENGGIRIPEGELIYGRATLSGDRLIVRVSSIRWMNSILPVSLSVFDQDGLEGIHIPGAINRDLAKESGAQGVDALDYPGPGSGIAGEVAGAGISAAHNMLDRRIRLVRVSLPEGYPVLLVKQ